MLSKAMFISAPENIFIQLLYKTHLLHHQIIQKVDICLLRAWKYCCLQLYLLACVLSRASECWRCSTDYVHYLANCSNEGGPSFTIATGNGCLDTGLNRKYGMNASAVASRGHTGTWTCRWLQCLNWFKLTQHGVVLVRSNRNSLECTMFNTIVKTG